MREIAKKGGIMYVGEKNLRLAMPSPEDPGDDETASGTHHNNGYSRFGAELSDLLARADQYQAAGMRHKAKEVRQEARRLFENSMEKPDDSTTR